MAEELQGSSYVQPLNEQNRATTYLLSVQQVVNVVTEKTKESTPLPDDILIRKYICSFVYR